MGFFLLGFFCFLWVCCLGFIAFYGFLFRPLGDRSGGVVCADLVCLNINPPGTRVIICDVLVGIKCLHFEVEALNRADPHREVHWCVRGGRVAIHYGVIRVHGGIVHLVETIKDRNTRLTLARQPHVGINTAKKEARIARIAVAMADITIVATAGVHVGGTPHHFIVNQSPSASRAIRHDDLRIHVQDARDDFEGKIHRHNFVRYLHCCCCCCCLTEWMKLYLNFFCCYPFLCYHLKFN